MDDQLSQLMVETWSVFSFTGWQAFHVFSAQPHLPVMVLPGHQWQLWDNPWGQKGSSWWEVFSAFDGLQRPPSLPLHRDQPQDHRGGDHGPRDLGHQLERRGRPERQNQQYGQLLDQVFLDLGRFIESNSQTILDTRLPSQPIKKGRISIQKTWPCCFGSSLASPRTLKCFQSAFLLCAFIPKFCFTEKNTY